MTPEEVELTMKALPIGKATGPDGISNRMLKEISKEISIPVAAFFNYSFSIGKVPDAFKESHAVLCPKEAIQQMLLIIDQSHYLVT